MDPKFCFPASPGTPLFAVSPERVNRQSGFSPSPSLPSDLANIGDPFTTIHAKTSSDVQGKVAQFNNLSKEAIQRRRDNEAALKRAVMGREEAENETKRLKEENRVLRGEIEEGRGRERRVSERVETVMEELQRTKGTHAHSQALYEKEVRRARKEAFKSSSALVKLQEELKSARNKFTLMREEVDVQRRKVDAREQETFTAQYQLVGLQEDVETLGRQKKVIEEERDALKTSLKEEEVARIAAEGRIALPVSREGDEFASPTKKSRSVKRDSFKENVDPEFSAEKEEIAALKDEIRLEKKIRRKAEDQIDFMKMECQFQCCSCRVAERQGVEYLHDAVQAKNISFQIIASDLKTEQSSDPFFESVATPRKPSSLLLDDSEPLIKFSPTTGTFYKTPSPIKQPSKESIAEQWPPSPQSTADNFLSTPPPEPHYRPSTPPLQSNSTNIHTPHLPTISTPFHRPLPIPPFGGGSSMQTHTIKTITTTVPLIGTPIPAASLPFSPDSTMTREEALEQIRVRRGRARSIAAGQGTPRKPMVVMGERRDVSAPAGRVGR